MGLIRTALVFGAGYALGHPTSRAKLTQLARRPEVAQLRRQAVATVAGGVEAGRNKLVSDPEQTR